MKTVIIKSAVIGKGNKPLPINEPSEFTDEEADRLVSLGAAIWPPAQAAQSPVPQGAVKQSSAPDLTQREKTIKTAISLTLADDPRRKKQGWWDKDGKPRVQHVRKLANLRDVTADERDRIWFSMPESAVPKPDGLTAKRITLIKSAVAEMTAEDPAKINESFWTSTGKPTDDELDRRIAGGVTADERDWVLDHG